VSSTAKNERSDTGRGGPAAGLLVVVSGPSGVGKSTVVAEVRRRTGADFSISVTTRPPRNGEVEGREYRFVDRATFERMIAAGELLEHAEVFGEYYGTPAGPVRRAMAAGRTVLLEIDVQGGIQVRRRMPEAVCILLLPPETACLARRLRGRGTDSEAAIARRVAQAEEEVRLARQSGAYEHYVVNDDLRQAVREIVDIVSREQERT